MGLLPDSVIKQLEPEFKKLDKKVKLVYFTQALNCMYCKDIEILINEVADLTDKLEVVVYNFVNDKEMVEKYNIKRAPAIVPIRVLDDETEVDYGIKFYGIPGGYEFTSLIQAIMSISFGKPALSQETIDKLAQINTPVHLQVFVTPSCPYCPQSVILAHEFALASEHITADMIEAQEFPVLSNQFQVHGVPKTVINDGKFFEGAYPEHMAIEEVLKAIK